MPSNNKRFSLSDLISEDLPGERIQSLIEDLEEDLVKILEKDTVRVLLYTTSDAMEPKDMIGLEELLRSIIDPEVLFLIIDSPGGEPETALRIIRSCRKKSQSFQTIIPDMAKSAATQVCLGSETIWMGTPSEIGPIGPKIPFRGTYTSAKIIIKGLKLIEGRAKENEDVPIHIYSAIAQHYDPALLKRAEKAIEYVRNSAVEITKRMFDDKEKAKKCINELLEMEPHGKAINIEDAKKKGLKVKALSEFPEVWSKVWEIFLRSHQAHEGKATKVFASRNDILLRIRQRK